MRIKKHALKYVVSLLMTIVLVFGLVVATSAVDADLVDAKAQEDVASTGIKGTVYFKNTSNWSNVNAYVWIQGTQTSVQAWPGQAMTLDEGNVYKYTVSGDYNMIIFSNNGANQTKDLSIPGAGYIYDFSTGSWSFYKEDPTTDDPTDEPTQKPTQSGETKMVYCKNSAGWGSVNTYMWINGTETNNSAWPGKPMTNIGDDIWQYEVTGSWNMIIFNNGSTQTGNLEFPGDGYIYDNLTGQWSIYDTSPIKVSAYGSDLAAPQYKGTDITLTADAKSSGGDVAYRFCVTFGGKMTVLSDFTTTNTASWTPTAAGTYTITYDFKDTAGNTNQRTLTYEIKDDSGIADPILKGVSPKPGQIKNGTAHTFTANAAGGKTGTNLLFYKFTVKDANGVVVNVPHYTKNASYNFTPRSLGTYTLTVSVQNCDNELIERTFTYTSVTEVTDDPIPTIPSDIPTSSGGYLKGDTDGNGEVNIMDATAIQLHLAKLETAFVKDNADVDRDGEVNIMDATGIQLHLARLDPNW